jgi:hypothetical protein
MNRDWEVIEASKKAERARLAALPIEEKLRILEAMILRRESIQRGRPLEKTRVRTAPGE